MSKIQKEYIDLQISVEDTPHYFLERASEFQLPQSPLDAAEDLLVRIEEAIKKENATELYILSNAYFPKADLEKFSNEEWPKPNKI